ncbi:RDD family protein [Brevibacterium otitidis]|uniref:RDD family protein n=1 Tax=Brevibacterium otitidis TaxID=53364 RepID=A0ABV5X2U5_9MICO|nr:RDD family protein [Brevibacterium otitidis]
MSSLVTGEAIALDVRPAALAMRAVSCAIDYVIIVFLFGTVMASATWLLNELFISEPLLFNTVYLLLSVFCLLIVPFSIEILTRGRSVGKIICGLRIVREDGGAISARHALLRALLYSFEIFGTAAGLAALVGLLSPQSKRLGDYLAGTIAVNERAKMPSISRIFVPQHLEAWARGADISSIPNGLYYRITQFLISAHLREPDSRWERSIELAEELNPYIAPAPPQGTLPEEFLAAVVASTRAENARQMEKTAQTAARFQQRVGQLPFGLRLNLHEPAKAPTATPQAVPTAAEPEPTPPQPAGHSNQS